MVGRIDSFLLRAQDHGCNNCGARGDVFYAVQFYILPSRLVRKRHKGRTQNAIYCRDCYEAHSELPFLIDGTPSSVPTNQVIDVSNWSCHSCPTKMLDNHMAHKLYGLIISQFNLGVNSVEELPLAFFCGDCVESHKISLMAKI